VRSYEGYRLDGFPENRSLKSRSFGSKRLYTVAIEQEHRRFEGVRVRVSARGTSRISVGLIGFGYWGPKYLRLLREHPRAKPSFVVDEDPNRLSDLNSRDDLPTYTRLVEAIEGERPEAVIVVTPASSHRQVVAECLRRNVKVLVEKPLATSLEDGLTLANLSRTSRTLLYPGNIYAHNDGIAALTALARQPDFGDVRYVTSVRAGLGPVRGDVSALWDLMPHDLAILDVLGLVRPQTVSVVGRSYLQPGIEDVAFGTLTYNTGQLANLHASWMYPHKIRQTSVVGAKKMVVFDDTATEDPIRVYERGVELTPESEYGVFRAQVRTGAVNLPFLVTREPLRVLLDDFLKACETPRLGLDEVRRSLEILVTLETMARSARSGGTPCSPDWSRLKPWSEN
jgi:predicted dehydrogenase